VKIVVPEGTFYQQMDTTYYVNCNIISLGHSWQQPIYRINGIEIVIRES